MIIVKDARSMRNRIAHWVVFLTNGIFRRYLKMKNVECPYCHVREDRQVVETGQVSVGKPMQMYKFKCDGCGRYFWKHEKVSK